MSLWWTQRTCGLARMRAGSATTMGLQLESEMLSRKTAIGGTKRPTEIHILSTQSYLSCLGPSCRHGRYFRHPSLGGWSTKLTSVHLSRAKGHLFLSFQIFAYLQGPKLIDLQNEIHLATKALRIRMALALDSMPGTQKSFTCAARPLSLHHYLVEPQLPMDATLYATLLHSQKGSKTALRTRSPTTRRRCALWARALTPEPPGVQSQHVLSHICSLLSSA